MKTMESRQLLLDMLPLDWKGKNEICLTENPLMQKFLHRIGNSKGNTFYIYSTYPCTRNTLGKSHLIWIDQNIQDETI